MVIEKKDTISFIILEVVLVFACVYTLSLALVMDALIGDIGTFCHGKIHWHQNQHHLKEK